MRQASANVVAEFTASPSEIPGDNVELKLVLSIYFDSSVAFGNFGAAVEIDTGQGASKTFRAFSVDAFSGDSETFIFDTIYTGPPGTYLATFSAMGTENDVLCQTPGLIGCQSVFSPGESRNVGFNLSGSTEIFVTPLPSGLPLFAGGLGVIGLIGWRRKRNWKWRGRN
jgi:hypothetical protein